MRDVGRALEKPANHLPLAHDLQAFLVFSQHPACIITLVIPQEVWSIALIYKIT